MSSISEIRAREILDSRGNPTVGVEVALSSGAIGRFFVPSGASTGSFEALELRDKDKNRYGGKGVKKACANVQGPIQKALKKIKKPDCESVDRTMIGLDGTPNKGRLGANAIVGVSVAFARAIAAERKIPFYRLIAELAGSKGVTLPTPLMNVINGGRHADNSLDFQEFMIVPSGFDSTREALRAATEVFQTLKSLIKARGLSTGVGDEGGFAPQLKTTVEALDILVEATRKSGYRLGSHFRLALDCAATELYQDGRYHFPKEGRGERGAGELISLYKGLQARYPLASLEDGLAEEDWEGWKAMTRALGFSLQLVGDDIFVTNPVRFKKGIEKGVANAILIKLNQIGTLTETLETIRMAKAASYRVVISHRSGETEDSTIADLAVGTDAGQIKTGGLSRGERIAKYNRLLEIADELGPKGVYAGAAPFAKFG